MNDRLIAGLLIAAAAACASAQPAPDTEKQRRLAEQKLKLAEVVVNSQRVQAVMASSDREAVALIERGRSLLAQARDAMASQRYADASQALDEALQNVSKANGRDAGASSDAAQRQQLQEMTEQVSTYRASLAALVKDKGAAAKATLERVDVLVGEARRLSAAGQLAEANRKMAQAYRLEVEEVSRLRAGQEVVMSLKFDTPADEYAYEQKRFHSNEILVGMMIGEGRADGDKRRLVDGFLQEAAKLKEEAVSFAQSNLHKEAVAVMEKATTQLNRALQSMGVPVY